MTRKTAAFVLVGVSLASTVYAEPRVDVFETGTDYKGVVRQIAIDPTGGAWMATSEVLYRIDGGRPQVVVQGDAIGKTTRLAIVSTKGVYGRLTRGNVTPGLFTMQLFRATAEPLSPEMRLEEFPFGFGTVYLGASGDLIVTATPLGNAEDLRSDFLYAFWSSDGRQMSKVVLPGRRVGIVDVGGNAILLLGDKDAFAYTRDGTQIWRLDGDFRKGALAGNGQVALLNPAASTHTSEVHLVQNGQVIVTDMHAPVQDVALSLDGSEGAVAVDQGGLRTFESSACTSGGCEPRTIELQVGAGAIFVTAVTFVDNATLAVGLIHRTGSAPSFKFPSGEVLAITTAGTILVRREFDLTQPATWTPSIDVTFGVRSFAAHTPQRALFVQLGP